MTTFKAALRLPWLAVKYSECARWNASSIPELAALERVNGTFTWSVSLHV